MRQDTIAMKDRAARSNLTEYWRVAMRCRVIAYIAAVLPLLLMIVLAGLYPDLNRTDIPDWRPLISLADESRDEGDLYQARHLYICRLTGSLLGDGIGRVSLQLPAASTGWTAQTDPILERFQL